MQFHLSTLFFAMLVVATSMAALMGGWGIPCGLYVLALATLLALGLSGNGQAGRIFLALLILTVLVILLLPIFSPSRESARRCQCGNNLKQLWIGLANYHDVHGCLPPAIATGKDGKPMHSWRVQILPFVEHVALYKRYKFDEPWDGPNNRGLLTARASLYACPSDPNSFASGATTTDYVAVTGSGTVWDDYRSPQKPPRKLEDDRRIMLVEVAGADIPWTEPRDLTVEDLASGINSPSSLGVSSHHEPRGAHVVLANGKVIYLPRSVSPELLRELATQGLDSASEAKIAAIPWDPPDGPQYLGARLACWLLSITAYTFHVARLGRKHRKRQQVESSGESNDRGSESAME